MIQMCVGPWESLLEHVFPDEKEEAAAVSRWRFLLGLFLIFLQCLILVGNAMLTQYIFDEQSFESPFLMTYFGISLMAILVPIQVYRERLWTMSQQHESSNAPNDKHSSPEDGITSVPTFDSLADDIDKFHSFTDLVVIMARRTNDLVTNHVRRWNHRKHFMAALVLSPAMFMADWAFNGALLNTSIASSTVLLSIQSIFVYVMAVVLKLDGYSNWKLLGVLAGVGGTALTALHDETTNGLSAASSDSSYYLSVEESGSVLTGSIWGDALAVLAAMAYATYTIQVRLFCPDDEDLYSMQLLLGYVGVLSLVPLAPIAIWLCLKEVNLTLTVVPLVMLKGFFDFCVTDYLLFRSIILTGPTVATVGLGLSIPMAFLADLFLGVPDVISWYSSIGALACIFGFVMVNAAPTTQLETNGNTNEPGDNYSEYDDTEKQGSTTTTTAMRNLT